MANGTLIDEATYYGDTENYIGSSGSETNMWVIEDCYDFIEVMEMTDVAYYMRLVNDIDFNEHDVYKKGFNNKQFTPTSNPYLYGDGHKIKNIVAVNCSEYVFPFSDIENVDFVNLVSVNCSDSFIIQATGTVNNCNYGIFFSNGSFNLRSGTYNDCTFNMKGKLVAHSFIVCSNTKFERCHFNFDVNTLLRPVGNGGFIYSVKSHSFINCYFTGKLKDSSTTAPAFSSSYTTLTNCYFAFEYSGLDLWGNAATTSVCFIDKELYEKNGNAYDLSKITALTTAQAQDYEYLNSIGFPVVPIE